MKKIILFVLILSSLTSFAGTIKVRGENFVGYTFQLDDENQTLEIIHKSIYGEEETRIVDVQETLELSPEIQSLFENFREVNRELETPGHIIMHTLFLPVAIIIYATDIIELPFQIAINMRAKRDLKILLKAMNTDKTFKVNWKRFSRIQKLINRI